MSDERERLHPCPPPKAPPDSAVTESLTKRHGLDGAAAIESVREIIASDPDAQAALKLGKVFNDSVKPHGALAGVVSIFGATMARFVASEHTVQRLMRDMEKMLRHRKYEGLTPELIEEIRETLAAERKELGVNIQRVIRLSDEIRAWRRDSMEFVGRRRVVDYMEGVSKIMARYAPRDPVQRERMDAELQELTRETFPAFEG